jgi:hypothetical protein
MADIQEVREVTAEEADEYARIFRKKYPYLYVGVLAPKKGGTFLYCTHPVEVQVPKLDKIGRKTGRFITELAPCNKRFRLAKRYRHHWRKIHRTA